MRCRHLGIALTLSLAGSLAFPASALGQQDTATDTVLRSYYSGNGLLNRGMYELAADEYRAFLADNPNHEKAAVARYGLGVCLYRLNDHAGAVEQLQSLATNRDFPYVVESALIVGRCHLTAARHDDAAHIFAVVTTQHRDHDLADDAGALLIESLHNAKRFGDAVDAGNDFLTEWKESPVSERAELFIGLSLAAQNEHDAAARRFNDLLERYPRGKHAQQVSLLTAQSFHRNGDLQNAVRQYRAVTDDASNPYRPDALYGAAAALHELKQLDTAASMLDTLLESEPRPALQGPGLLLRGRIDFEEGRYRDAVKRFEALDGRATDLADDRAYWLAKCEIRMDEPQQAAARLTKAIKNYQKSPLLPEMMYDCAVALLQAEETSDSIEMMGRFLAANPNHALAADALQLTAAAEHQIGRYDDSLKNCTTFLRQHRDHSLAPAVLFLVAENQFMASDYKAATDSYRTFASAYPDHERAESAQFRLGMALYHMGAFDDAKPLLAGVAEKADDDPTYRSALLSLGDGHFQRGEWAMAQPYLADYVALGDDLPAADDAMLKLGLTHHRLERYEPALDIYTQLLETFPKSDHRLQALFERGQALLALKRDDDARIALRDVVDKAGDDSMFAVYSLNHLASLEMKRGAYTKAAELYKRVASSTHAALVPTALVHRGQALSAAGQHSEAESVLKAMLKEYPNDARAPEAAAHRAIAISRQGRHDDALKAIKSVENTHGRALVPTLAASLAYERAWCERELGQTDDAMKTYQRVLAGKPEADLRHHAMLEISELHMDAEQYAAAAVVLSDLSDRLDDASSPSKQLRELTLYRQGVCAFRQDQHDDAVALLERFIDTFKTSDLVASASLLCGEALYQRGSHRQAAEHLARVTEDHPESEAFAPSLLRLGECMAAMQQWEDSEDRYQTFLATTKDSPSWYQAQFGVGWARENRGEYDDAITAYRDVVDRHRGPTAARAQFQIGECLYAQEQYHDAVRELLKVDILYGYPEWSAAALYEAGRCFEALGQPVDARKQYKQVTAEHGDTEWAVLSAKRLDVLSKTGLPGRGS